MQKLGFPPTETKQVQNVVQMCTSAAAQRGQTAFNFGCQRTGPSAAADTEHARNIHVVSPNFGIKNQSYGGGYLFKLPFVIGPL